jgi:pimeloyl-ACP methyl ester carboxylesterase
MNENMSFKIPNGFESARIKILVTVGEKERKIMKNSMAEIIRSNPNCKGVIISKVGHGFSLAIPTLFNNMLGNWIERHATVNKVNEINSQN